MPFVASYHGVERLVVIGAGAAGLAAAAAGRRHGFEPLILDRGPGFGGAWAEMAPDMLCLSSRRHDVFPDGTVPAGLGEHATATEVLAGLQRIGIDGGYRVHFGTTVLGLRRESGAMLLETTIGPLRTRRVVVATGEWGRPYLPELPGCFEGPMQHSREVAAAEASRRFQPGEHVFIVGAGNSGSEVSLRALAAGCHVTVSSRGPLQRPPLLLDGPLEGLRFWASGVRVALLPGRGGCRDVTPLASHGFYDAVRDGRITWVSEAVALEGQGVKTRSDGTIRCDRVIFATGFRRDCAFLAGACTLDARGAPVHGEGVSPEIPGLAVVGLPCMRTRRSGFLRGFVDDAMAVMRRIQ